MKRSLALAALIPALFLACSDVPAGPDPAPAAPRFNFLNGPSQLPNVVRYQDQFFVFIFDPETGLIALAGAPDDPREAFLCPGGTEPFALVAVQDAGLIQDVIHALVVGPEVNLHVYDFATFTNACVSTPIAQGTGRVMYTDNDRFATGSRTNAWGFRMHGEVTLASNGDAHLVAHNRFTFRDGEFRLIHRMVRLSNQ